QGAALFTWGLHRRADSALKAVDQSKRQAGKLAWRLGAGYHHALAGGEQFIDGRQELLLRFGAAVEALDIFAGEDVHRTVFLLEFFDSAVFGGFGEFGGELGRREMSDSLSRVASA